MFTINLPFFGGSVMNGFNQVKVFQSELEAQAYARSEFPERDDLLITPIHLVGLSELV
jgi:hypothetical protein